MFDKQVVYTLYDATYSYNPEKAIIYDIKETLKGAQKEKEKAFPDAVIVEEHWKAQGGDVKVVSSKILSR
jgi:hypothetical protein